MTSLAVAVLSVAEAFFPNTAYALATNGCVIGISFATTSLWSSHPETNRELLGDGVYRITALVAAFTIETFIIERNTFFTMNIFSSIINCAHMVYFITWACIEVRSAPMDPDGEALKSKVFAVEDDASVARACARWRCIMGFDLESALKLTVGILGACAVDVWGAPMLGPGGLPGPPQRNIASLIAATGFCRAIPLMTFDGHHPDHVATSIVTLAVLIGMLVWTIIVHSWPQVAYIASLITLMVVHFAFSLIPS
jgi:hypothetical protein